MGKALAPLQHRYLANIFKRIAHFSTSEMEEELLYEVCLLNHSTIFSTTQGGKFFVPIITDEFDMIMASCLLTVSEFSTNG